MSRLFNLALYQRGFGGNHKIAASSINLGCTRGRGSSTRIFNWCTERSPASSTCINQFINVQGNSTSTPTPTPPTPTPPTPTPPIPPIPPTPPTIIYVQDIATYSPTAGFWELNNNTIIATNQTLIIRNGEKLINIKEVGQSTILYYTLTNNGIININNGGYLINSFQITNNGTINNSGKIENREKSTFINNGIIYNTSSIYNYGSFTNYNIINSNSYLQNGENTDVIMLNRNTINITSGLFLNKATINNNTPANSSITATINIPFSRAGGILQNDGKINNGPGNGTCRQGIIDGNRTGNNPTSKCA